MVFVWRSFYGMRIGGSKTERQAEIKERVGVS